MMLGRTAHCVFLTSLVAFAANVEALKMMGKDSPLAAASTGTTNKAWQLLKESLHDQAPLLHSMRVEEKKKKATSSLRGNRTSNLRGDEDWDVYDEVDIGETSMEYLDAATAESYANDDLEAAADAAIAAATAAAAENDIFVDHAAEGKQDTRPVIDTASEFEHDVTDLMLGIGGAGFGATPMGSSVRKMKSLIATVMLDKVKKAHSSNQQTLNRLAEDVGKCGGARKNMLAHASKFGNSYKSKSPLHKSCRAAEANLATEKNTCEISKKQAQTMARLSCNSFSTVERQIANQVVNVGMVKKAAGERAETYIRRLSTTVCGSTNVRGKGGYGKKGYLDKYLVAKEECQKATVYVNQKKSQCQRATVKYLAKKQECNGVQALMDNAACSYALGVKDACENDKTCYNSKAASFGTMVKVVKKEEVARKAEWRGLKRMQCLINAFTNGKVTNAEVDGCKALVHSTKHLVIKYPKLPKREACSVPRLYPASPAYKRAEFAVLPALAKGQFDANECTGVEEVSTKPAKGSPRGCKCTRVTLLGSYSAGPLVKCLNCWDARRANDRNSCPRGTKLFSPRTRADWQTIMASGGALRAPHWIVDITRSTKFSNNRARMNSRNKVSQAWETSDDSPWWLRSTTYSEPNGDYSANCFLNIKSASNVRDITFNDGSCNYHSKSYYCQPEKVSTKPRKGSPRSCHCTKVLLTGKYSAGSLVKCENCRSTRRSRDVNSCPKGMKIFSPASRSDWKVILASAGPLRAPNWIVDVTRPQNGCGGCTRQAMKSANRLQATWRTSDGSSWWLRSRRYNEPNGDYSANCYMDLWRTPSNEDDIKFNDGKCGYSSTSYYCQPAAKRR